MPVPVCDTRPLFRPLTAEVLAVLRSLSPAEWERPTLAPAWRVRDVVAHMLDTALRRLSYQRDGMEPLSPPRPIASENDLAAFVNELNAAWVGAAARLSPRVLVDLYTAASPALCDVIEGLPDDAPPLFPVSWAGDRPEGLLDVAREFTEIWHHGAQVRDATGAGPFREPRWLHAVLATAVQALPHAYRGVHAAVGAALVIQVTGDSGGTWTLSRTPAGWDVSQGAGPAAATAVMSDEIAWRLFFNALPAASATAVHVSGDLELARPLLRARAVIV